MPVATRADPSLGALDVVDEGPSFVVRLDAPGATLADVDVTIEGVELSIRVCWKTRELDGAQALLRERRTFDLARRLTLPGPVDVDAIGAFMRDGVLEITIPKLAGSAPRRIAIKSGGQR